MFDQHVIKWWLRRLQLSRSRECKNNYGFFWLMNILTRTKFMHERCCLAFLLQAAHKIAVSCPKCVCCKLLRQINKRNDPIDASPDIAKLFSPFGCTNPPPPVPPFLLMQNQSPKDIADSDML